MEDLEKKARNTAYEEYEHKPIRDVIRAIEGEIKNIEDRKHIKAREWMGALFGGLLECSEKGTVVATLGHTIIGNPFVQTAEPNLPRAHFSGESQAESLVVEASERELDNISIVDEIGSLPEQSPNENRAGGTPSPHPSPSVQPLPQPNTPPTPPINTLPPPLDQLKPLDYSDLPPSSELEGESQPTLDPNLLIAGRVGFVGQDEPISPPPFSQPTIDPRLLVEGRVGFIGQDEPISPPLPQFASALRLQSQQISAIALGNL